MFSKHARIPDDRRSCRILPYKCNPVLSVITEKVCTLVQSVTLDEGFEF